MKPQHWQLIQDAFHRALEQGPEALSGLPPELRVEVEALLDAHHHAGGFLDKHADAPGPGTDIDIYRLMEKIGEGGMGVVYRAVRNDGEFRHEVAIKFIGRAWAGLEAERRFLAERQILARLNHPGIIRLLDGGSHDGRRYLVMELVEGLPITEHCRRHNLSIASRVELVLQLCRAIAFAHANLIIHRDIKPSNVVVTPDGLVKVLDFGIARLLDDSGGTTTRTLLRPLTLDYASPEQVSGEPLSVTSDLYSIGLILYELLAGFNPQAIQSGRLPDVLRNVVEVELPPLKQVAAGVPADLSAIVAKAVAKEPLRRYQSATDMQRDLERFLDGRPVEAQPASRRYVMWKAIRRNPALTALSGALLVAVLAGSAGFAWQARVADRERERAQRRLSDARRLIWMVIHEIQPALEPFADAIKVRKQLIDASLQYLEKMSAEAGDNVALLRELSSSYLQLARVQGSRSRSNLGDRNAFKASLAKASALADRLLELDPSGHDTLRLAINIASEQAAELSADGRKEEAAAFGNRAVELADRMVTAHPQSSMAQEMLASALFARPGEANMERARKIYEQLLRDKPDHPVFRRNLALTLKNLSGSLYQRRDYRGGLELAIQARDIDQRLSNEDPANQTALLDLAIDWSQMGAGFYNLNNWEKAKAAFEASIAIREKLVAANPKDARPLDRLTWAKADLAEKTMQRGEVATALPILQDASALYARLASFHPLTDGTLQKAATNEYWLGIAQQKRGAARAACGPFARAARMLDSLQQAKPLASQEARIREEIQRALAKCPPAAPSPAAHPGPQKAAVNR